MADRHIEIWSREKATPSGGWWAVCECSDDDAGPYPPVALFRGRAGAEAYAQAVDADDPEVPLVWDPTVTPAVVLADGTVVYGNDYDIETHAQLLEAIAAQPRSTSPLQFKATPDIVTKLESQYPPSDDPLVRLCHVLDIGPGPDIDRVLQEAAELYLEVSHARMYGQRAPEGQIFMPVSADEAARQMVEGLRDPLVDPQAGDICLPPGRLDMGKPVPIFVVQRVDDHVFAASQYHPLQKLSLAAWQGLVGGGLVIDPKYFWTMPSPERG